MGGSKATEGATDEGCHFLARRRRLEALLFGERSHHKAMRRRTKAVSHRSHGATIRYPGMWGNLESRRDIIDILLSRVL